MFSIVSHLNVPLSLPLLILQFEQPEAVGQEDFDLKLSTGAGMTIVWDMLWVTAQNNKILAAAFPGLQLQTRDSKMAWQGL